MIARRPRFRDEVVTNESCPYCPRVLRAARRGCANSFRRRTCWSRRAPTTPRRPPDRAGRLRGGLHDRVRHRRRRCSACPTSACSTMTEMVDNARPHRRCGRRAADRRRRHRLRQPAQRHPHRARVRAAGVAGIHIEDQVAPKQCGHMDGKQVVPRDGDGRQDPRRGRTPARDPDFVIIARTDARAVDGLDAAPSAAPARTARPGADMLFVEAPESDGGVRAGRPELADVPLLFNWAEGGKTPPSAWRGCGARLPDRHLPDRTLLAAARAMRRDPERRSPGRARRPRPGGPAAVRRVRGLPRAAGGPRAGTAFRPPDWIRRPQADGGDDQVDAPVRTTECQRQKPHTTSSPAAERKAHEIGTRWSSRSSTSPACSRLLPDGRRRAAEGAGRPGQGVHGCRLRDRDRPWHDFIKNDPPLAAGATAGIDRLVVFQAGLSNQGRRSGRRWHRRERRALRGMEVAQAGLAALGG